MNPQDFDSLKNPVYNFFVVKISLFKSSNDFASMWQELSSGNQYAMYLDGGNAIIMIGKLDAAQASDDFEAAKHANLIASSAQGL